MNRGVLLLQQRVRGLNDLATLVPPKLNESNPKHRADRP
jgi:hypothetical protein